MIKKFFEFLQILENISKEYQRIVIVLTEAGLKKINSDGAVI